MEIVNLLLMFLPRNVDFLHIGRRKHRKIVVHFRHIWRIIIKAHSNVIQLLKVQIHVKFGWPEESLKIRFSFYLIKNPLKISNVMENYFVYSQMIEKDNHTVDFLTYTMKILLTDLSQKKQEPQLVKEKKKRILTYVLQDTVNSIILVSKRLINQE